MFDCVTVTASARLHLGFLDLNGGLGRRFGSLGLAIDRPLTRLSIRRAATASARGREDGRALRYLAEISRRLGLEPAYELTIHESILSHAGLGSGTQLALALAAALRRLEGLSRGGEGDALLLQRGSRSGIGIGVFEYGGVIVDGGRGQRTLVPPIIARIEFPPKWRVLIVLDPQTEGIHGSAEQTAFARLGDSSPAQAAEICRLVLIKALPALVEQDIGAFGGAVTRIQEIAGDYFAPAQGGARYSSAAVARLMEELWRHGAHGTGQSSWGPTGFAFAASAGDAQKLCVLTQKAAAAQGLEMLICKGVNHGALIEGKSFAGVR